MKIQKLEIKNFKCLDHKVETLNGNNVYLIAPNAKGKTTFIDAAFGHMPTKPLKEGERKGEVLIELDEYNIEFKFSDKNQKAKLNIFDKTGKPQPAPATLFKELFGVQDFNIDQFLSLSPSKKVDFIKGIIGIDWADVDSKYREIFEERTYLNRQLKELDAKTAGIAFDPDLIGVDVKGLQSELSKKEEQNREVDRISKGVEERRERISSLNKELVELEDQVAKAEVWLNKNPKFDIEHVRDELDTAIENNSKIQINKQVGEDKKKAKEVAAKVEELTINLEAIQEAKRIELESAKMPVKGLSFNDDGLTLDGLPFESDQINTARRIIAGLEIQYALMNEVKIARFDGSLLDKNSITQVESWAKEKDIQLFVELVDRDGDKLKIEIQETNE